MNRKLDGRVDGLNPGVGSCCCSSSVIVPVTKVKLLQYCAKVMQTIIVEYRENRDISVIFNAN